MGISAAHLHLVRNIRETAVRDLPGYNPGMKLGAVLHAGGPAPASNAAIAGVVRAALAYGYQVVGFEDGFMGPMNGRALVLTADVISGIETTGGVFLGSSRFNPKPAERQEIVNRFRTWGINWLVPIGGDDTNTTAARFAAENNFPVVGVPKTIDNDVTGTAETYGHETVVEFTAELLRSLKRDGQQAEGPSFFLAEVMGRKSGSWAMKAARASGATLTLIPEMFSLKGLNEILRSDFPRRAGVDLKAALLERLAGSLEVRGRVLGLDDFTAEIQSGKLAEEDLKINAMLLAKQIAKVVVERVLVEREYGVIVMAEGLTDRFPTRVAKTDAAGKPSKYEVIGLTSIPRGEMENLFAGDTAWQPLFEDPSAMSLVFKGGLTPRKIREQILRQRDEGKIIATEDELDRYDALQELCRQRVIIGVDAHANPRLSDVGLGHRMLPLIISAVNEGFKRAGITLPFKLVAEKFGYPFRCLSPIGFDINLATSFGDEAVRLLLSDPSQSGRMVGLGPNGGVTSIPYSELPKDETGHLVPRPVDLSSPEFRHMIDMEDGKRNMLHPRN